MTTIALNKQSLLDIAIQSNGNIQSVFELALLNGISLTDDLKPGTELILPEETRAGDLVNYFSSKKYNPATAGKLITEFEDLLPGLPGILPLMMS